MMILIFTTIDKISTAQKIGNYLLKSRLIACYNLFPIKSGYWWQGKIVKDNEVLMILKTKDENFKKIENYIKKHSSYEVPEIVSIKATRVTKAYLNWLNSQTK